MMRTIVVLVLCVVCEGSRVLVVSPVPSRGHTTLFDSIVRILLTAGNEVTYISTYSKMKSDARLTRVNISSVGAHVADSWSDLTIPETAREPRSPKEVLAMGAEFANRLLQHVAVQELLSDTDDGYDAVVAEWYFSGLLAPLAAVYDCPLIWFSALDASWMSLQLVHDQTSPAYTVDSLTTTVASHPYDITSRFQRLWRQVYLTAWMNYITYYIEAPMYEQVYHPILKLRGRLPPHYESLVYNSSLMLVNSHPLVGQSLPLPGNVKYVGGHHLSDPVQPLPKMLEDILDNAKHGAILFSLGSHVKSKNIPKHLKQDLLQMFGQLEQTVIWAIDEKFQHLPGNVFTWKWVPQASILNHSNTIIFISNGGLTSLIEATNYGVPVIGVPLMTDQFVNLDLAHARGRAIRVDYSEHLTYDIKKAINEVLGNDSYRSNAEQAAAVFRNSAVSPQKELLHYIQLVINTRGAHHLRSPTLQLSTVQALYLDAVVLLLLVIWFLSKVVKVVKVHTTSDDEKKNK